MREPVGKEIFSRTTLSVPVEACEQREVWNVIDVEKPRLNSRLIAQD